MKIEVRRKIFNGLVIGLQTTAVVPRVADSAIDTAHAVEMSLFVANEVHALPEASSSQVSVAGGKGGAGSVSGDVSKLEQVDPSGGDPSGGDPSGGDPSGGDPSGGDPSGGDPSGGDPSGGDPSGGDPSGGDPSGGDPSGGDPSGCDPTASVPELVVGGSEFLFTDENGESDFFSVALSKQPEAPVFLRFVSSDPTEARPYPERLSIFDDACQPRFVEVRGQNDGEVDGDIEFTIEFLDANGSNVFSLPGSNADNDQISDLTLDVRGPKSLMFGEKGVYMVRLTNTAPSNLGAAATQALVGQTLTIETTPGLSLTGFACSYLSGANCDLQSDLNPNQLVMQGVDLPEGETLLLSIDALLSEEHLQQAILSAKMTNPTNAASSDDSESTPIAIFKASFEDDG